MQNYILPNFFESFVCNKVLINQFQMTKNLYGVSGQFPFSIFNGGKNNNFFDEICVYDDIVKIVKEYDSLNDFMLINMSNINLVSTDFYDCFNTVVLEELSEKKNIYFSIGDLELGKFIIENFPKSQIVLDTNYTFFHSDEEIYQAIQLLGDNFAYLMIGSKNICANIDCPKIYKVFFDYCGECNQYLRCINRENESVLEYSNQSIFANCESRILKNTSAIIDDIIYGSTFTSLILFDDIDKNQEQECYLMLESILTEEI